MSHVKIDLKYDWDKDHFDYDKFNWQPQYDLDDVEIRMHVGVTQIIPSVLSSPDKNTLFIKCDKIGEAICIYSTQLGNRILAEPFTREWKRIIMNRCIQLGYWPQLLEEFDLLNY